MSKKKIITIVGARPQIIKASAISRAIGLYFKEEIEEIIVHTGQHYDQNMSQIFFEELGIPKPSHNINVGSGRHGQQTAKMIDGIEKILIEEKPDSVILYGDTNSTIAGALAAAKIHIPVVHIEAGLRSFNKKMPEEINRIACDHMSSLLFSPTKQGIKNLQKEGFKLKQEGKATMDEPNMYHCGDIMLDNSMYFGKRENEGNQLLNSLKIEANKYILCTIHRDSNTDIEHNLIGILEALLSCQEETHMKIVLPLHPRTKAKIEQLRDRNFVDRFIKNPNIIILPPAGFHDIIVLEKNTKLIITDSGGLQKEAYFFKKPCVILREQTEWVEIVENGNAILTGADNSKIKNAISILLAKDDFTYPALFGDGKAGKFICSKILSDL
ncbi:MAG: UDP-N-acetylglucosamine 2-epimerase (non-hydrolyzing) [Crocinitomicaceae bacterium]|nr:UDP-N-acetylglucosamine 2-epimerase (non-hydrolyzing) [Crocinitomicaceae bacterium]